MIGKGGFGEVYLAQICPAGRHPFEAAVKIPHSNDNNDLKQEALIWTGFNLFWWVFLIIVTNRSELYLFNVAWFFLSLRLN